MVPDLSGTISSRNIELVTPIGPDRQMDLR
jgi:hypothetical protein